MGAAARLCNTLSVAPTILPQFVMSGTASDTYFVTKVKVVLYTFVRRGVPVREDTYPEPSACEVGWPVPFLAAFISPVFPLGTICCWVNSERAFSQGIESGSNRRPSAREACAVTNMLTHSYVLCTLV